MIDGANFLCEIGCEEIPAGYIPPAIESIKKLFVDKLEENRIAFQEIEVYATPRRIAIVVSGMDESQREEEFEIKGPSVKAAYDSKGNPSKALLGFVNGNELSIDDIIQRGTDKGDYIYGIRKLGAKKTREIAPGIIESVINTLSFPKRMRWNDKRISFPRPISYFLVLLDEAIVPFQLSGIESSNLTRGHYIQFNRMIEIDSIESYGRILEKNGVIIDQKKRKDLIMKGLLRAASKLNGELVEDDELLETVTFLTESPHIVACEFDRDFLKIPDIVLITEMREHQKYFAVRDRSGNLLSRFLVVSNNPSTKHVKVGNERVISARFNDARFFFNEDRKIRLFDRVESLKSVLFHKDLGTIYDKVMRMMFIAEYVSAQLKLNREITEKVNRSILLSKADLNTSMVFEFTSLQGKIGRIYALLDGEDEDVADAIDSHYKPRFQGDTLPDNLVGIVVSISEKLDNIFGSFSVGNIPKGSQDPYALRRQANAIVEIVIRNKINIDFGEILTYISEKYNNGKDLVGRIIEFISARAKTIFLESGFKYDEIDACLSVGFYDFFELFRRAESINLFRKNENFIEMLLSFKRMNNILVAFRKDYPDYRLQFNPEKLKEDAEKDLFLFFESKRGTIEEYIKTNRYQDLFHLLIDGKPVVDRFFDKVMVMAEDLGSRDNRLSLLENILYPFKNLLDFSRISE